jgi:RNA polymerase sigma-70 factor (ECF subfamily)
MTDPVTAAFESQRGRLLAIAHRVLGSHADAEDVVQEAWLRLSRQDPATIENLAGWLTTVVGRISLDVLRSRREQRPFDDLIVTADDGPAPEDEATLADSVGVALLVVLDSLGPNERLAFVLHDLFAVPFDEIGQILGKSTAATKMLASRARRKVQASPPRPGRAQSEVVNAFLAAARDGDFDGLLRVLDPDVRRIVESEDGVVVTLGATKVATGARIATGSRAGIRGRTVRVNGLPGVMAWNADGTPLSVVAFTVVEGRITLIRAVTDPVRLARIDLPAPPRA